MESILQNNGCFLRKIQRCFTRRDFLSTQEWRQKTKPLRRKVNWIQKGEIHIFIWIRRWFILSRRNADHHMASTRKRRRKYCRMRRIHDHYWNKSKIRKRHTINWYLSRTMEIAKFIDWTTNNYEKWTITNRKKSDLWRNKFHWSVRYRN